MKIAVTYEDGNIFPHFGRTQQFKLYDIAGGKVVNAQIVNTDGNGHGALAGMLTGWNVDTVICGGIGAGAQSTLMKAGIQFYGGVSGSADEAVDAMLSGTLTYDSNVHCDHSGHDRHNEEHRCGEDRHGCPGSERL